MNTNAGSRIRIVFAVIFSLILTFTMMPVSVFADEGITDNNMEREPSQYGYSYLHYDEVTSGVVPSSGKAKKKTAHPTKYNSVTEGYITSVKNQDPYGTCWAFATIGNMESAYIKKYSADKDSTDFSELQLAYFTFNQSEDPLGLISNDKTIINSSSSSSNFLDSGGDDYMATTSLSAGRGAVTEANAPYTSADPEMMLDNGLAYTSNTAPLENAYWTKGSDIDGVKSFIQEYGSVTWGLYYDKDYYNSNTHAFNNDYNTQANHGVLVVGWDDGFSKDNFVTDHKPDSNGAWLVKNSWDTNWGDNGYFWVSYEDNSSQKELVCVYEPEQQTDDNEVIYQYDGGLSYGSYGFSSATGTVSNEFIAQKRGKLDSVGVRLYNAGVDYTIKIYTGLSDKTKPDSGTLAAIKTGRITNPGYRRIDLDKAVDITKGETFSVVITQKATDGENLSVPVDTYGESINYTCDSHAETNQSFVYKDGTKWVDLNKDDNKGTNLRVKAYVEENNSKYTITYDGNGAASGKTPAGSSYLIDSVVTIPGNTGSLARSGYTFSGWNTKADGTGTTYGSGSTLTITKDTTLYAKWKINKPAVPAKVKAKGKSKKSIKVSWKKSARAGCYKVYRATKKNGKYKYVGKTTKTYKTVTKLKKNKNYYFKVKAYNSTGGSRYSKVVKAKTKR